jgi:hypothetical protein
MGDSTIATVAPDTFTLPVGNLYDESSAVTGVALGRTTIRVTDERVGFQRVLPGISEIEIEPRRLYHSAPSIFVSPGTRTDDFQQYLYVDGVVDSLWVQLRSVGGKFVPSSDSLLLLDYGIEYYSIRGLTTGTDTLVIEAPGFAPDSVIVRVGTSVLQGVGFTPSTIRQGDSVLVAFNLLSVNGMALEADPSAITFTVGSTGTVQATKAAGPITSYQLDPGQSQISFWVRALGPGSGTIQVTHANFTPIELTFSTRSP